MTFTATVAAASPGSGTPTGTVNFLDGTTTIGTGTLTAGVATFSTSSLTVGTHSITAVYAGDTNFTTSTSSAVSQVVNQASTTTLARPPSTNPSVFGQSVTFTATVAAVSPGSGTPTGTVNFLDGTTTIGTAAPLTRGRSDLQHQQPGGRHALDHRGLLRRHELHYQYLECRFPGCEPGEHDDRARPPVPTPASPVSR